MHAKEKKWFSLKLNFRRLDKLTVTAVPINL